MAHEHIVYDSDPHFSIDVDTRVITYQSPDKLMLIQGDHNSEVFTFDMPKEADGHNMMDCDIRQIHFINLDGERGVLKSTGIYNIDDMQEKTLEDGTERIVFSWTVPHAATRYVGSLSFAIKFACSGDDAVYEYVWNTLPYASVPVSKTIENTEEFIDDYSDVLQDWYNTIISAGQSGVNKIDEARRQAVASVQNALAAVGGIIVSTVPPTVDKAVAWLNPVDPPVLRIKGEDGIWYPIESIKGEPGGLNNIAQEMGNSTSLVISQKVVSEAMLALENAIYMLRQSVDNGVYPEIGIMAQQIDGINTGLNVVDQHLTAVDTRVNSFNDRLDSIEQDNETINDRVQILGDTLTSFSDAIVTNSNDITDLQKFRTNSMGDFSSLFRKDAELQEQIDSIDTSKFTVHVSGFYTGDGTNVTPPIYFGSKFKPDFVVIKDANNHMRDLIVMRDYYNSLYEGNAIFGRTLQGDTGSLIFCNFGEATGGAQRLSLSSGSGAASAEQIYNQNGGTYFWFAIGSQI